MLNGGDLAWITDGLKAVDPRVLKFAEINEFMAFKPWKLTPEHVKELQ